MGQTDFRNRLHWNLRYLLGHPRWDTGVTPPEVVGLIEGGRIATGRALDIGCGTGTNVIYLAQHGFDAVGVDLALLAIRRARRKARQAGVSARFYAGDLLGIGTPKGPSVGGPFALALDVGCLHSLAASDRPAYAAMLRRALQVGGSFVLYAWGPREHGERSVGLLPEETVAVLGDSFVLRWTQQGQDRAGASHWYWFEHRSE
jgi:SAM-dependent methyltransferase